MKRIFAILSLATALLSGSCAHKELCYDHTHTVDVEVVFDWKNAPDAAPETMSLYLFPKAGGSPLRYEFTTAAAVRFRCRWALTTLWG